MSLPFQTVRLSGKQPKPIGDLQHSLCGVEESMGQRTKLPYAFCLLHRLKMLFLLLSLRVTVLEGKQKQNVCTVISSFIQICIYELKWHPITMTWGSKQRTKAGSQGLWSPTAQFGHFQRSLLLNPTSYMHIYLSVFKSYFWSIWLEVSQIRLLKEFSEIVLPNRLQKWHWGWDSHHILGAVTSVCNAADRERCTPSSWHRSLLDPPVFSIAVFFILLL